MLRVSTMKRVLPATLVSGLLTAAALATGTTTVLGTLASYSGYQYGWGGILSSGPAASDPAFMETIFVQGQDTAVYYRTVDPAAHSSSGWNFLGGREISDPGSATIAGTSYVFIRGQDNGLWWRSIAGAFASQGGVLNEGVGADVLAAGAGPAHVFVRGQDNAVYYKTFTPPSTWSAAWTRLGGVIVNKPAAVSDSAGHELLVVRGQDNAAYVMTGDTATFTGTYTRLGGVFVTAITATSCSAGHIDLWGVGQDKAVWSAHSADSGATWSGWYSWGGVWSSDIEGVCRPASTTVDLYGRGQDFALWDNTVTGT